MFAEFPNVYSTALPTTATTYHPPRQLSGYGTSPQPSTSAHSEIDVQHPDQNNYRQIIPHITTSQHPNNDNRQVMIILNHQSLSQINLIFYYHNNNNNNNNNNDNCYYN